jgi:hypothetical protein
LAFQYALVFLSHGIATFFLFLSFYFLFKSKEEKIIDNKNFILAGFFSGLAVSFELPSLFILIGLFFYCFTIDRKKIIIFSVFSFLGIAPYLIYNYLIFGNFFSLGYMHTDPQIWTKTELTGKMGFVSFIPNLFVILRLLFYPYRGLFFYYPVLLLSIPGFFYSFKKHKEDAILVLYCLLSLTFIFSMWWSWFGGSVFGPRHLMPALPFLMIPIFLSIKKIDMRLILILFFISIFVNFVGLQPTEDDIVNRETLYPEKDYLEKVNSFEPLGNPLLNHYFPRFLDNGPQSLVLETILDPHRNFDIRYQKLNEMGKTPLKNIPLLRTPFGFLNLNLKYLSVYLIWLFFIFLFKYEILGNIYDNEIVIFPLLLLILFINFSSISFDSNWHQPENVNFNDYRWMSQNSTATIFLPKDSLVSLGFNVWSYHKPRDLVIYIDDINFTFENIRNGRFITTPVFVSNKSYNLIRFYSKDGCDIVKNKEGKEDPRCLSVAFSDSIYKEAIKLNKIYFEDNWYSKESEWGFEWRWISNNATIFYYSGMEKIETISLEAWSYHKSRKMRIFLNNKSIEELTIPSNRKTEIIFNLTLKKGINQIQISSLDGCDIPSIIETSKDTRCLSFAFSKIKIGKNEIFS